MSVASVTPARSILITGCSSGIGRCAADLLRKRGYRVFASARKPEDVDALRRDGFEAVHLDLADSSSIRAAVAFVLEATGGSLYGLFNNGAYGQPGAVEDLQREVLVEQFQTNVFGTHELTQLVVPVMRRQGGGRIIHNSSLLGLVSLKYRGAYNASKYALEGLADTQRLELDGSNVFVSLVEPGPILSRFRENSMAVYRRTIDVDASVHRDRYRELEERLAKQGAAAPFTLGPEAVVAKVIQALEAGRPKPRYFVTFPTYLFAALKRCLPAVWLDRVCARVN
ncbi:SDR family oxidoreductase [Methylolobus aquaticus]|nr:SDR family oxidoreductase [Methylolobus aquaticus]